MKKLFFSAFFLTAHLCQATLHVTMLSTPVVIGDTSSTSTSTLYYTVDVDNNGIDDFQIKLFRFGDGEISFESLNDQHLEAEVVNDYEGIAYNCGASFGATNEWYEPAYLADDYYDYQYENKGPRYLAVRKRIGDIPYESYVYGWVKIECPADADVFIIYGYAYDDALAYNPTIVAGEGECINATAITTPSAHQKISLSEKILTINSTESYTMDVFDISGKLLLNQRSPAGTNKYDLQFNNRILLVKIDTGGNNINVFKVFNP